MNSIYFGIFIEIMFAGMLLAIQILYGLLSIGSADDCLGTKCLLLCKKCPWKNQWNYMSPVECSHIFLLPANYCELFSAVKWWIGHVIKMKIFLVGPYFHGTCLYQISLQSTSLISKVLHCNGVHLLNFGGFHRMFGCSEPRLLIFSCSFNQVAGPATAWEFGMQ
jgi:hypothetical protein